MKPALAKYAPAIAVLLAAAWVGSRLRPSGVSADGVDLASFGRIPVVQGGRVMPLDSFARTQLRTISEKETFTDKDGVSQPAIRWLLDAMVFTMEEAPRAREHATFRIVNPQLLGTLGLQERSGLRYSIREFGDKIAGLEESTRKAGEKSARKLELDAFERELLKFDENLRRFMATARLRHPHVVPPSGASSWRTVPEGLEPAGGESGRDARATAFVGLLDLYARKDVPGFNEKVKAYLADVTGQLPAEGKKSSFESAYNRVDAFNVCKILYLLAFLATFVSWMGAGEPLRRSALWLQVLVFGIHTLALGMRIWISGRPPVTNLYSSALFVGWGCVGFGLVFERIFRMGSGNAIAASAGFLTLQIAHVLAADGDTMQVLQAVLDTQFWLSTHVTTISMGYAATYVAGLLGVVYVLRGLLTPSLTPEVRGALSRMIYGTVCFATFFSFVGTVLGGLWADDSWGRFWGWDPKENGALLIVLWNAVILHARWGGLVRERGLAALAVLGNAVTTWSWFGVNELSVGLHSYGFTEGRSFWITITILGNAALACVAMLPRGSWRSPDAVRERAAAGAETS